MTVHAEAKTTPFSVYLLAISVFIISTAELLPMGLLLELVEEFRVSIPAAGSLVTVYALGVVIGGPLVTILTVRVGRKKLLISLLVVFILGSLLGGISSSFAMLMASRIVSAFSHGAFFGVAVVLASKMARPGKEGASIALVGSGLTLATVLGGPLGTLFGQHFGWRTPFLALAIGSVIALLGIVKWIPSSSVSAKEVPQFSTQMKVLVSPRVLVALSVTVFSFAGVFLVLTYIAPILEKITQLPAATVAPILLLYGVGTAIGNLLGGKYADRHLIPTLFGGMLLVTVVLTMFSVTIRCPLAAVITIFFWGMTAFTLVTPLNMRVLGVAKGAEDLASSMNISAFNLGNAGGAFLGGLVVESQFGLQALPLFAAAVTVVGIVLAWWGVSLDRKAPVGNAKTSQ